MTNSHSAPKEGKISQIETKPWHVGMNVFPGKSHQPKCSSLDPQSPFTCLLFSLFNINHKACLSMPAVCAEQLFIFWAHKVCVYKARKHIQTYKLTGWQTSFEAFIFDWHLSRREEHSFSDILIDWCWYPFNLEELKSFSPVYIQFCQLCFRFPESIHSSVLFILMSANGPAFDRSEINALN